MEFAERVKKLPPYIFAEIEKEIAKKRKEGIQLISLSIGDPDLPPPNFVMDVLSQEVKNPNNHKYSLSQGEADFRQTIADWYKIRFSVDINPEKETMALIGAKEGLANIARAFINPGDKVLVPDPAYPVYRSGATILCGGHPIIMPLLEDNSFFPDLDSISNTKAKMMFLNYPNNPTGAVIEKNELENIVEFALDEEIILCYDNSYSEITFDGYVAPSIFEIEGAKDIAIEFNSCSKMFNMTGDRIGFLVGNPTLIDGLTTIKAQIDSGPPIYTQKTAIKALQSYKLNKIPPYLDKILRIYTERRDFLVSCIKELGFKCTKPKGTFYIWFNCETNSMDFANKILQAGVVITPGIGFGSQGENYVRIAFTKSIDEIDEAFNRISDVL